MSVCVCASFGVYACVYIHTSQRVQNGGDNVTTLRCGVDDNQLSVCI